MKHHAVYTHSQIYGRIGIYQGGNEQSIYNGLKWGRGATVLYIRDGVLHTKCMFEVTSNESLRTEKLICFREIAQETIEGEEMI